MIAELYNDTQAGQYEVVSEMRREVFEIEKDIEEEHEQFYDDEANNIQTLGEDYTDGQYYDEDVEEF